MRLPLIGFRDTDNAQVEPQKGRTVLSVGLELDVSLYLIY
jgi:hypothetical protein